MGRKSKSEPLPVVVQSSRLAERARQRLITGAVVLCVTLGATWWYQVPLSFNADTPLIMLTVAGTPFGLVFLLLGAWAWLRNRKSGGARLEYRPPHDGGILTGFIRLDHMPDPLPDFTLMLLHRTRKYDDSRADGPSKGFAVTWKKEVVINAESVRVNNGIPLAIPLPPRNYAGKHSNGEFILQVRAPLPGLDFYQEFRPHLQSG